jgi:hypothetical protein
MNMRSNFLFLAACLHQGFYASPIGDPALQVPLEDLESSHPQASSQQLHGRFLHITGGRHNLIFYTDLTISRPASRCLLQNPFVHRRRGCLPSRHRAGRYIRRRNIRLRYSLCPHKCNIQMDRRKRPGRRLRRVDGRLRKAR